ncbi:hypothetical protein IPL85_03730 [Candidatus Saccharibacteria bacterium]|nr:MAG: hypothetical protein IPL85_03730 [Candidatus Saccharibacteria bacterium]
MAEWVPNYPNTPAVMSAAAVYWNLAGHISRHPNTHLNQELRDGIYGQLMFFSVPNLTPEPTPKAETTTPPLTQALTSTHYGGLLSINGGLAYQERLKSGEDIIGVQCSPQSVDPPPLADTDKLTARLLVFNRDSFLPSGFIGEAIATALKASGHSSGWVIAEQQPNSSWKVSPDLPIEIVPGMVSNVAVAAAFGLALTRRVIFPQSYADDEKILMR